MSPTRRDALKAGLGAIAAAALPSLPTAAAPRNRLEFPITSKKPDLDGDVVDCDGCCDVGSPSSWEITLIGSDGVERTARGPVAFSGIVSSTIDLSNVPDGPIEFVQTFTGKGLPFDDRP